MQDLIDKLMDGDRYARRRRMPRTLSHEENRWAPGAFGEKSPAEPGKLFQLLLRAYNRQAYNSIGMDACHRAAYEMGLKQAMFVRLLGKSNGMDTHSSSNQL